MSESATVANIRLALSRGNVRLFRNNVGALQDRAGRFVTYGLAVGSSDLIGYVSIIITPDMVGNRMAVFCALEVKDAKGRVAEQQANFIRTVNDAGGRAAVVRSVEEARQVLHGE